MNWKLYRWVWQLRSPLHIGATPAGSLNRTRLYIPARVIWGALTAELARKRNTNFPEYQNIGQSLRQRCRFTYLFPAQQANGRWQAWLPQYEEGHGLIWRREDRQNAEDGAPDRVFRSWLLTTRPGTAIQPDSDTAAEGTLREYEVITPWSCWDGGGAPQPVAMAGYLFLADNAQQDVLNIEELIEVKELFIGGDTRYGLGRVQRVECSQANNLFGRRVMLTENNPPVETPYVLAHSLSHRATNLLGAMEQLAMWNYDELVKGELTWAPGSKDLGDCTSWRIREDGLWESASG
jgi:hypothetical protein